MVPLELGTVRGEPEEGKWKLHEKGRAPMLLARNVRVRKGTYQQQDYTDFEEQGRIPCYLWR